MEPAKSSAREIIVAVLTELYHFFLRPDVQFEPIRLGKCVVNQPAFVTILENRVIRVAGVSCRAVCGGRCPFAVPFFKIPDARRLRCALALHADGTPPLPGPF